MLKRDIARSNVCYILGGHSQAVLGLYCGPRTWTGVMGLRQSQSTLLFWVQSPRTTVISGLRLSEASLSSSAVIPSDFKISMITDPSV